MADNVSAAAACLQLRSVFDTTNLIVNSTASPGNNSLSISLPSVPSSLYTALTWLSVVVTSFISPAFCAFGVLGNLLTMLVLSGRSMKEAMSGRIKRASRAGLIGLAVADLLCSTSALAITYGRGDDARGHPLAYSEHQQLRVLSIVYGPFVQNACVKSNAWLTVVVAVGRYIVICRPLHARYLVSVTATRVAIMAAFIVAVLIELPSLWTWSVVPLVCPTADGTATVQYFVLAHGRLVVDSILKMTYDIVSISLGFIVPVGVLIFCNCRLIRSLRQSYGLIIMSTLLGLVYVIPEIMSENAFRLFSEAVLSHGTPVPFVDSKSRFTRCCSEVVGTERRSSSDADTGLHRCYVSTSRHTIRATEPVLRRRQAD